MATNSGSSNPSKYLLRVLLSSEKTDHRATVGEQAGPVTGNPPAVSSETAAALNSAAQTGAMGTHASAKDAGSKIDTSEAGAGEKKVKSEKERMDALDYWDFIVL